MLKTLSLRAVCLALSWGARTGQRLSGQSVDFDIAPFGRRCCVEGRHVSPVILDFPEAKQGGSGAEKAADGRYLYGLQWAEGGNLREIQVHFAHGSVAEKVIVEYWYRN